MIRFDSSLCAHARLTTRTNIVASRTIPRTANDCAFPLARDRATLVRRPANRIIIIEYRIGDRPWNHESWETKAKTMLEITSLVTVVYCSL